MKWTRKCLKLISQYIALSHFVAIVEKDITIEETLVLQRIIWNEEPGGNIEHIEAHGLTVVDVEHVLATFESEDVSRSSGLPCVFGYTPDGTYIIVVYELIDADTLYPITAYPVPEP